MLKTSPDGGTKLIKSKANTLSLKSNVVKVTKADGEKLTSTTKLSVLLTPDEDGYFDGKATITESLTGESDSIRPSSKSKKLSFCDEVY